MSGNGNGAGDVADIGGGEIADLGIADLGTAEVGGAVTLPSAEAAVAATAAWIDAVVWGDHAKVWELIGSEGRDEVLEVATKRGMDEGLAARLKGDTASPAENNEFLADLVNGLRAELAGNDLDNVTFELEGEETAGDRAAVKMFVPLHPLLGGTLPIGTVYLGVEAGDWRVTRLIPLTSK
jgi:hypothetical protein